MTSHQEKLFSSSKDPWSPNTKEIFSVNIILFPMLNFFFFKWKYFLWTLTISWLDSFLTLAFKAFGNKENISSLEDSHDLLNSNNSNRNLWRNKKFPKSLKIHRFPLASNWHPKRLYLPNFSSESFSHLFPFPLFLVL